MTERIKLSDDKEVIYAAYQKALSALRVEKFRNKAHIQDKKEIRKEKNKKINTMSYKHFRMTQVLWGVNKRIERLKNRYEVHQAKGRRDGYKKAIARMDKPNFKADNASRFIGMLSVMTDAIGLSLHECSFLMWANRYDYFTKSDFTRDMQDTNVPYYGCLTKLKSKGMIMKIEEAKEFGRFKFCLNAIGKATATKIDKFVKKIN